MAGKAHVVRLAYWREHVPPTHDPTTHPPSPTHLVAAAALEKVWVDDEERVDMCGATACLQQRRIVMQTQALCCARGVVGVGQGRGWGGVREGTRGVWCGCQQAMLAMQHITSVTDTARGTLKRALRNHRMLDLAGAAIVWRRAEVGWLAGGGASARARRRRRLADITAAAATSDEADTSVEETHSRGRRTVEARVAVRVEPTATKVERRQQPMRTLVVVVGARKL